MCRESWAVGVEKRLLFERDQAVLDGELDQAGQVAQAKLLHQPGAVRFHTLGREREQLGDLRAGFALCHQLQDFPLARAELIEGMRCGGVADVIVDHRLGDFRAQVAVSRVNGADGLYHFHPGRFLEQVALRPGLQRAGDVLARRVDRKDNDPRAGARRVNLPRGLDAVQFRHGNIHHDHVRASLLHPAHRLPPVGGIAHDGDVALRLEQGAQPVADHGVVVGHKNADRHASRLDDDARPLSGRGFHAQAASHALGALLHRDQSPGGRLARLAFGGGVKAHPIVGDDQSGQTAFCLQPHRGVCGVRVPRDVGQRLLSNPEQRRL